MYLNKNSKYNCKHQIEMKTYICDEFYMLHQNLKINHYILQLKYYLHQNVSMSTLYAIPERKSLAMLFYPYPDVTIREDCM